MKHSVVVVLALQLSTANSMQVFTNANVETMNFITNALKYDDALKRYATKYNSESESSAFLKKPESTKILIGRFCETFYIAPEQAAQDMEMAIRNHTLKHPH